MIDIEKTMKGLQEAEGLLDERVPERFMGYALEAVRETMKFLETSFYDASICKNCGKTFKYLNRGSKRTYCDNCQSETVQKRVQRRNKKCSST